VLTGNGGQLDGQRCIRDQARGAAIGTRAIDRPGQAPALPGQERSWEEHLCHRRTAGHLRRLARRVRGPCSGSAQAAPSQWKSAGLGALRGVLRRACRWGFHVRLGSPTGFLFGAWSRGDGAGGDTGAKPAPLEVFSPDPKGQYATPSVTCRSASVGIGFSAASTGALAEPAVPQGSQLLSLGR